MGQKKSKASAEGTSGGAYRHAHRKMPYRSEELEVSPEEKGVLAAWLEAAVEVAKAAAADEALDPDGDDARQGPVRVIFDTDIGTDVDDALALLMLLHLPKEDVELLGVTTTYGYTQIRAKVAQEIITAYERGQSAARLHQVDDDAVRDKKNEEDKNEDEAEEEAEERHNPENRLDSRSIPVIPGAGIELGTHRDAWHTGTEGMGLFPLDTIDQAMAAQKKERENKKAKKENDAARFIASQVRQHHPNQVVVIGLGALTNVAEALALDPGIVSNMRLVYMGMGHRMKEPQTDDFPFKAHTEPFEPVYHHYPNHNISSDTLAAVRVFATEGLRIDVINDAVTNEIWWTGDPCLALMHATAPPESEVVGRLLKTWLYYRSAIFYRDIRGTCPHDALTVAEAIYPDRFVQYARGHLMIHEWAGFSTFVLDEAGPHRIGVTVAAPEFRAFLSNALTRDLVSRPADEIDPMEETRLLEEVKMRNFVFAG